MIEVIVTIALSGVLMGLAVGGWSGWSRAQSHQGAATDLQALLRNAQQRAVTEGSSLCMVIDAEADTWRLERGRCETETRTRLDGPWGLDSDLLDLVEPRFTGPDGTRLPGVTFTSHGTASPGSVRITRSGSDKVYEIRVEGLTGRVSIH
jgi:type II secretory pathway pseudopilin PulG